LVNGTTYYYVVVHNDDETPIAPSDEIFETPQVTPVIPATPTGLTAVATANAIQLAWDAVPLAAHYTVERALSPAGPFEPVYDFARDTSYTDYGLQSNQGYSYRIVAFNSFGDSLPSAVASAAVGTLDHTLPTVTVTGVVDRATYLLGNVPTPGFSATDSGGIATQDDVLIEPETTSGAGQYTQVVTVRDNAGNETIVYTTYWVDYDFSGFKPPLHTSGQAFPVNRSIPVKFELNDSDGNPVTDAQFTVLVDGRPVPAWPGSAPVNNGPGQYIFRVDPGLLSQELHTLTVILDDTTSYQTTFRVAAPMIE
jgi:hypothetical protein